MKKIIILLLVSTMLLCFTACGETVSPNNRITIPDILDTDETTAKNILSSNGLIPSIKYENSEEFEQGNVIRTEPQIGESVEKNSKVTIYISDGPSYISSSDSRIQWWNLSTGDDDWEFYSPYIENNILYINCYNVTFSCDMEWSDRYNNGELIGIASITDSFDKTVPVSAKYEKQSWKANESQSFILEIPLKDLNVSQPTDMYLRLYTNNDSDIRVNFYMTW